MSKTFTSRPAVTRGRGRGARPTNIQSERGTGRNMDNPEAETDVGASAAASGQEQRMNYNPAGFTMIAPNQKKRDQVTQMAQREEAAYKAHKEQKTPKSFNIVGTAGGGQISEAQARQHLVQNTPSRTQRLQKAQQHRNEKKRVEEEELQKKKAVQRQKAEENERLAAKDSADREKRWGENHRRANEAFLKRFENKVAEKVGNKQSTGSSRDQSSSNPHQGNVTASVQTSTAAPLENLGELTVEDSGEDSLTPEQKYNLDQLSGIFVQYSRQDLLEVLQMADFSIERAIDLLH